MIWLKMVRLYLWDLFISSTAAKATTECAGAVAASTEAVSASAKAICNFYWSCFYKIASAEAVCSFCWSCDWYF